MSYRGRKGMVWSPLFPEWHPINLTKMLDLKSQNQNVLFQEHYSWICSCSQFRAGGIVPIQFFLNSQIFFPVCFSGTCKIYQPKKKPLWSRMILHFKDCFRGKDKFGFSGAGSRGIFCYWAEFSFRASLSSDINNNYLFWESLNWSTVCAKMFVMQETKHLQSSSYILRVMSTLNYTVLRQFKNFWSFSLLLDMVM